MNFEKYKSRTIDLGIYNKPSYNTFQCGILSTLHGAFYNEKQRDTEEFIDTFGMERFVREYRTFEFNLPRQCGKTTLMANLYQEFDVCNDSRALYCAWKGSAGRDISEKFGITAHGKLSETTLRGLSPRSVSVLFLDEYPVKDVDQINLGYLINIYANENFFILSLKTS